MDLALAMSHSKNREMDAMTCESVYPMQHTHMRRALALDSIEIIYLYQAVNPNAFLWISY